MRLQKEVTRKKQLKSSFVFLRVEITKLVVGEEVVPLAAAPQHQAAMEVDA